MKIPPLSQINNIIQISNNLEIPNYQIAILRNITIEPIESYHKYLALQAGFHAELKFGSYDNILQEAESKSLQNIKIIMIHLWLPAFSELLDLSFARLSKIAIESEIQRVQNYCTIVLHTIRQHTSAAILWHGFEMPTFPSFGILDKYLDRCQLNIISKLNLFLLSQLKEVGNSYLIDMTLCVLRIGAHRFYDYRYWHMARSPYSQEALCEIAKEDWKYIRAIEGKAKKCLILDCDNILWGGTIGEDGINGIQLGNQYPGSIFYEFQHEILNLYHRGIILALCSKNNYDDVLNVIRQHPSMILHEEHFAIMRINWQDKATNIKEIAANLNLGLDSMVFIDDEEFEINLVHNILPEVEILHFPKSKRTENRINLINCGLFDTLSFSEEDHRRGETYRIETKRQEWRTEFTNLNEYLLSLEMRVSIMPLKHPQIDRAVQLSQRTNQFNLTTKRYSHNDILILLQSPFYSIMLLQLTDIFGDYGIVGLAIIKHNNQISIIETMLLSCRVLGRGVENVFLAECIANCRYYGSKQIIGQYIQTKKNSQVADFYLQHGFHKVELDSENIAIFGKNKEKELNPKYFILEDNFSLTIPSYFKEISVIKE